MKTIQWAFNVVILGLVLFLLFYKAPENASPSPEIELPVDSISSQAAGHGLQVRYVNSDSLYKKFDLVNDMRKDLESRQKQFSNSLESKVRKFEQEVQDFQQTAQGMSQFEGQQKQKELMEKEQQLGLMQQELSDKLMQMEGQMHKDIRKKILDHLKTYKENGIDLVLDYSASSSLLMASDSLDITKEVTKALNEAYSTEKELN